MNTVGVNQILSGLTNWVRLRFTSDARKWSTLAAVWVLMPLLMQACASSTPVVETGDSGRYTLHASAAGGSVAWARSHKAVMQSASDFCAQRGAVPSVVSESSSGVRALEAHDAQLTFECHPRF